MVILVLAKPSAVFAACVWPHTPLRFSFCSFIPFVPNFSEKSPHSFTAPPNQPNRIHPSLDFVNHELRFDFGAGTRHKLMISDYNSTVGKRTGVLSFGAFTDYGTDVGLAGGSIFYGSCMRRFLKREKNMKKEKNMDALFPLVLHYSLCEECMRFTLAQDIHQVPLILQARAKSIKRSLGGDWCASLRRFLLPANTGK